MASDYLSSMVQCSQGMLEKVPASLHAQPRSTRFLPISYSADVFDDCHGDSLVALPHYEFGGASEFVRNRDALEPQDVPEEIPVSSVVIERIESARGYCELGLPSPEGSAVRVRDEHADTFPGVTPYLSGDALGR